MSVRQSTLVAAALALTVSSAVALAEPFSDANSPSGPPPASPQAPGGFRDRQLPGEGGKFKEQLNLSDAQVQQLEAIRQKYRGQMAQLREKMQAPQQELRDMMAGTASASEIRAQHAQLLELRQQLGNLHFESMLEMREVLTPQQRGQFAQMMQQHREHRGQFRNRLRDRPDSDDF